MDPSNKDSRKNDDDCDRLMRERMRYFMGRHLTACDFTDEQAYHRSHRLFHNRILHGRGVICGFEVKQHGRADCREKYVQVSPGIAIDCCGREIVVECIASCGEQGLPEIPWKDYKDTHPDLLLCLCYEEKKVHQVPVLHDKGDCSDTKTDYGRYEESWKLSWRWVAQSDLTKYHWNIQYGVCPPDKSVNEQQSQGPQYGTSPTQQTQPAGERKEREPTGNPMVHPAPPCPEDDCGDPCSEGYKSCIEPRCPPDHCVPLALICAKPGQPVVDGQILMGGRPQVPYGATRLTHIVDINWPHGGVITPTWFKGKDLDGQDRNGRFRIKFDRKLKQQPGTHVYPGPWGINEATFVVQYGELYEDLDFVISDGPPKLLENLCEAEYKISSRKYHDDEYRYLENHIIWITLKCDFLYDCHGVRVDGNNNGNEGGTFESWFSVVSEQEYDQLKKEGKL
jgi:hypothetical protein